MRGRRLGYRGGVRIIELGLLLPFLVAIGVAAHAALARVLKAVLGSWAPLASGEPQSAAYERRVYHTAERAMLEVVGAAGASGALLWAAIASGRPGWWPLALLAFALACALDLLRWERVAVSAGYLWFQRGWRSTVHQVALENIRDCSVEESDGRAPTLRHPRRNRLVRLQVRMKDKRVVALPKTDAARGRAEVAAVAEQLRLRLAHLRGRAGGRPGLRPEATAEAPADQAAQDDELRVALLRLRQKAAARRLAEGAPH